MTNQIKTIVIWDYCGVEPIKFIIMEGDLRRFNEQYIRTMENDALETELTNLMFAEDGLLLHTFYKEFPLAYITDWARQEGNTIYVITCGIIP